MKRFLPLAACALPWLVSSCAEVPVTGRSALSLVRHEDVVRVGIARFQQLKMQHGVSRDPEQNARLKRVGERIAAEAFSDVPDADWEFAVLNEPTTLNASASPGGKVVVYSGLLKLLKNDAQLAWVLAHEIGHVAARHSEERYSQAMLARGGALATAVGLGASGNVSAGVQAFEISSALASLAFDRRQEIEADYIGLVYMARAGYDPQEGASALNLLIDAEATAGTPMANSIFATHPSYPERSNALTDRMPRALEEYQRQKTAPPIRIVR